MTLFCQAVAKATLGVLGTIQVLVEGSLVSLWGGGGQGYGLFAYIPKPMCPLSHELGAEVWSPELFCTGAIRSAPVMGREDKGQ